MGGPERAGSRHTANLVMPTGNAPQPDDRIWLIG